MEYILSGLIVIVLTWLVICFMVGLCAMFDDTVNFDDYILPVKITFYGEMIALILALFIVIVCFVKKEIFG